MRALTPDRRAGVYNFFFELQPPPTPRAPGRNQKGSFVILFYPTTHLLSPKNHLRTIFRKKYTHLMRCVNNRMFLAHKFNYLDHILYARH